LRETWRRGHGTQVYLAAVSLAICALFWLLDRR
jgi:hypothetical protein